jgi:hypothetical protein
MIAGMKHLCLLSLVLFLSACVTAVPQQMPERFLGWWEPVSRGRGCVGTQIYPDGKIEDICNTDGKLIQTAYYKIIHTKSPTEIYLAVFYPESMDNSPLKSPDHYMYVMAKIEKSDFSDNEKLEWRFSYAPDIQNWYNHSPRQLWQDYKEFIVEEPRSAYGFARPL